MPSKVPRDTPHRRRLSVVRPADSAKLSVHVGQAIRARREVAGLTQERAAAIAGITRNTLIGIEKAALPNPTLSTLLALMSAFGLRSLDELLGTTNAEDVADAWSRTGWQGGTPRPLTGR